MPTTRSIQGYVCAALGVAVGVYCLLQTQAASKEWMDPIVAACTAQGDDGITLVPYNASFGGSSVCIITQFLHALAVEYPGGLLTWVCVLLVSLPFSVISAIEAGRVGAGGPVCYAVIMGLLGQLVGACIIMPALWIPSYVLGGGRNGGAFHQSRPMAGVFTAIPFAVLSICIFAFHPSSDAWRNCAGILGGPLVTILPLIYYLSPAPSSVQIAKLNSEAAKANYVKAFQFIGVLSLVGWAVMVYNVWVVYGGTDSTNASSLLAKDLWWEAHPAVKFMAIDTTGFFVATLLYTYLQSPVMFVKTILLTPLVGPGAALSFVLATTEPTYVIPKEKE